MNERKDEELKHMLEEELGKHYDLGSACEISLLKYSENYNSPIIDLQIAACDFESNEYLLLEILYISLLNDMISFKLLIS